MTCMRCTALTHLVPGAHAAVDTHVAVVAEAHGPTGQPPARKRARARHEAALGALRVHPRLKGMPLFAGHMTRLSSQAVVAAMLALFGVLP